MDFINLTTYEKENDGYCYILTIMDHFTKFGWAFSLPTKQAIYVHRRLLEIFFQFDPPEILQSDNGWEFIAAIIAKTMKVLKVEIRHEGFYHLQSQ